METITATRTCQASPETVYDLVTDLTRMGEWSPENQGGQWLEGATGPAVGARFKGRNQRKAGWSTTAVVTDVVRGQVFAFAVGKNAPKDADATWRYDFEPAPTGCVVTETCQILRQPGPVGRLLTKLGTGVSWADRPADLRAGMEETLRRLAAAVESGSVSAD